jgi:hypothetical protein
MPYHPPPLYTCIEVASLLGISPWTLRWNIREGRLPPPSYVLDRKFTFVAEDIAKLRAALGNIRKRGRPRKEAEGVPA